MNTDCQPSKAVLHVQTLGDLQILANGETLPMLPSRKSRALLGYLLLGGEVQRRERLCELLWDSPRDPRGALRWSLSKLRTLLEQGGADCLSGDRERVALDLSALQVDLHRIRAQVADPDARPEALAASWTACQRPLLQDCELPEAREFSAWLERERTQVQRLRTRLARRLALLSDHDADDRQRWADAWLADTPYDAAAAVTVVNSRVAAGRMAEAQTLRAQLAQQFEEAGLPAPEWRPEPPAAAAAAPATAASPAPPAQSQQVRFVRANDGVRLAWASVGAPAGPPLVKAANWLSHLELDWEAPIWSPLFHALADRRQLIRYDERGCGLSDWDVPEISFESFVTDLETVVDAAGLERFPLLGISQGASVSIEYAARHPERVSHLILFGGYPAGWRHLASPAEVREREAIMVLTEAGWGRDDPSYRHLFSCSFMPDATAAELDWFDEFQRRTTSAANAVRFLDAFSRIDVRARLAQLRVPTLVLHSRGDQRIPLETGRELAAVIPNAEFVSLDSPNHLLLGREAASQAFLAAIESFLARHPFGLRRVA
ncbi:MAG: alpha/beta fold hydrolase [Lysobacterales bacterium]